MTACDWLQGVSNIKKQNASMSNEIGHVNLDSVFTKKNKENNSKYRGKVKN